MCIRDSYVSYRWQDNTVSNPFIVTEGGDFSVEVIDEFGCMGTDSLTLIQQCPTELYIPNVFSPNGDNQNDEFVILGGDIQSMELKIFNRWGELIFESNDQERGWDGTIFGQEMALPGVYIYRLDFVGFKRNGSILTEKKHGTLTLIR